MKTLTVILLTLTISFATGNKKYIKEIKAFQKELNDLYLDKEKSPLSKKQRKKFKKNKGHNFFPIEEKFRVVAQLDRTKLEKNIQFPTSTTRIAVYDVYARATFTLNDKEYTLNLYQSHRLREKPEYADNLFLPFKDLTAGEETYGGGKFLDLTIPDGDTIVIDFNKSYHPYCAYSDNYYLDYRIEAGVMNFPDLKKSGH